MIREYRTVAPGSVRPGSAGRGCVAMKLDTTPPRGMKDLLPAEVELRDRATATILATYTRYGFRRIETPALENLRLLLGSGGGENEKLIYKVLKRGRARRGDDARGRAGRSRPPLRPDGTPGEVLCPPSRRAAGSVQGDPDRAGVARRASPERPVPPVHPVRHRHPGRVSEIAEIELMLATSEALIELGLERPRIRLNDRRIPTAMATLCGVDLSRHGDFFITLDKLDKIGRTGVERELREAGHDEGRSRSCSPWSCPRTTDRREPSSGCRKSCRRRARRSQAFKRFWARSNAKAAGDSPSRSIPRWSGAWATTPARSSRAAYGDYGGSIAGGGRYDRMVGRLLGQDVPACGFSIGFERVVSILEGKSDPTRSERNRLASLRRRRSAGRGRGRGGPHAQSGPRRLAHIRGRTSLDSSTIWPGTDSGSYAGFRRDQASAR